MFSIIFGFIFTISLLVFIHEYGHYSVARYYGVKIEEFSIGFGKELFAKVDKEGVKWKICLIPLGGFVKMYKDQIQTESKNRSPIEFYSKPAYQRFLIILAGPAANFLLAFLILACFYFFQGKLVINPIIEEVVTNSPAELAGLKIGDKIIKVRKEPITDFVEFKQQLTLNPNLPLPLTIQREDKEMELIITSYLEGQGQPIIGIRVEQGAFKNYGILASSYFAIKDINNICILTLKILGQMLIGERKSNEIHGVITVATESANSLNQGPLSFIIFLAMISINLGLVNILPIPVLDGGHLMFTIYEMIAKKPLSLYIQNAFNKIGLVIIIFLAIISTFNDIQSLIK